MKKTIIGFSLVLTACTFDASGLDTHLEDRDASVADAASMMDACGMIDAAVPDAMPAADAGPILGCSITCTDDQATVDGLDSWKVELRGPFVHSLCSEAVPNASSKLKVAGDWNSWLPGAPHQVAYLGESGAHVLYVAKIAGHFNFLLDNAWFDLAGGCEWESTPVHCTIIDSAVNTNCHVVHGPDGDSILF